jgi:hypothetical protein
MSIRTVDSNAPIKPVPEVDREAGAAEHEERPERTRRAGKGQVAKQMSDSWSGGGARQEKEGAEEPERQEKGPEEDEGSAPRRRLDYKA